ncbi:helix-turn-helix domain-containing protein [Phytomonospora sp. NPDC050363]|uniref:helix-turn-helix domain-containing protein n=1 Tax=Phytomonospora sp. NPDC050363 TaxID=3155642 RepID=UPI0033D23F1B
MPTPDPDDLLPEVVTATGAAEILGRSRQMVVKLADGGKLKGRRADGNGAWIFRREYIEEQARLMGGKKRTGVHVD